MLWFPRPLLPPHSLESWFCGLLKKNNYTLLCNEDPTTNVLSFANLNQQLCFLGLLWLWLQLWF